VDDFFITSTSNPVNACQGPWGLTSIASFEAPFYPIQLLTYYKTGRQEEENKNGGKG